MKGKGRSRQDNPLCPPVKLESRYHGILNVISAFLNTLCFDRQE